jgi:pimeloyl-ACP methyl ester carboxylesterase
MNVQIARLFLLINLLFFICPVLSDVSPVDVGLPKHWKTYYLPEPIFNGEVFIAEVGDRKNSTVILVHGLGNAGLNDWLTVVPELEKNYHLVLLDLPGFARSQYSEVKLTPTKYSELIHHIKNYFTKSSITLVGHSMGGAVALRYGHLYPEHVNKLILVDVAGILQRTAFVKHSLTDQLSLEKISAPDPVIKITKKLENLSTLLIEKTFNLPDATSVLDKSELLWGMALSGVPNINAALGLAGEDFSQAIYEFKKPVFILWGAEDKIAPLRTSQVLLKGISQASLTLIEDAQHMPMVTHKNQFNRWIKYALETTSINKIEDNQYSSQLTTDALPNYQCRNQTQEYLTGNYAQIDLDNCTGINLKKLRADRITIKNSIVNMEEVELINPAISVDVFNSTIIVTAAKIAGKVQLDKSRIDFAGVDLKARKPFCVKGKSRLIISISRLNSADGQRFMHKDITTENEEF